ncbi:MAG TPA: hypothetical protein VLC08_04420, partial [Chitinolyticbacter sp.]|nr:hypothetical protein [Chitinolyticbacter sp.]
MAEQNTPVPAPAKEEAKPVLEDKAAQAKPATVAGSKTSPASKAVASKAGTKAAAGKTPTTGTGNTASGGSNLRKENDPFGGRSMKRILLVDLSERDHRKRLELAEVLQRLNTLDDTKEKSGGLTAAQQRERARLTRLLDNDVVLDPFYRNVVATLHQRDVSRLESYNPVYLHKHGLVGSQLGLPGDDDGLDAGEQEIAGVCGLLLLDNYTEPDRPGFRAKVTQAQGEYRENSALFQAVFRRLSTQHVVSLDSQLRQQLVNEATIGCIRPDQSIRDRRDEETGEIVDNSDTVPSRYDEVAALSARSVAGVVRKLAADRITANDPWLSSRIEAAFDALTGVLAGGPPSSLEISLPDLEESVDVEIVQENLHAVQAIYFSFMLEEARMFQVVERIVELFRQGLLPLGRGKAGDYLFRYYKSAGERITEAERRDLYMRAFGAPGGDPNGNMPNREFNELWLRFVSSVSNFARQISVEKLLR